ncbi:hypothetical protein KW785_02810 [Candidatus Parcubacteria bacterium]|nr:hypothetical protein [Candidatus Parcubacteria bacterium]
MENNTEKLIQDQFNSLPLDIKESIGRVPWRERVQSIAKREGLSDDKASVLETETTLILYGFLPPEEYQANIVREVDVDEETAERIIKEVTNEIFAEIEKQYELIDATTHLAKVEEKPVETPREMPKVTPTVPQPAPEILPEVVPGQTAHEVPHVEFKKEPLVSTPTYAAPTNPPAENTPKRPDLNLPKSDYTHGQDPYHEPLE